MVPMNENDGPPWVVPECKHVPPVVGCKSCLAALRVRERVAAMRREERRREHLKQKKKKEREG